MSGTRHPPTLLDRLFYTHVHKHTHTNPVLAYVLAGYFGGLSVTEKQSVAYQAFHLGFKAYIARLRSLSLNRIFTLEFI